MERQGLLKGRRISSVQQAALQILIVLDRQAADAVRLERVRETLLGANPDLARALYPAYFSPLEPVEEVDNDPSHRWEPYADDTPLDFSGASFEHPDSLTDHDHDLLSRLLGNKGITVSERMDPDELLKGSYDEPDADDAEWI